MTVLRRFVGVDRWSAICWDVTPGGGGWTVRVPGVRLELYQLRGWSWKKRAETYNVPRCHWNITCMFCFEQEDRLIEILLPSPRVWFRWKMTDRTHTKLQNGGLWGFLIDSVLCITREPHCRGKLINLSIGFRRHWRVKIHVYVVKNILYIPVCYIKWSVIVQQFSHVHGHWSPVKLLCWDLHGSSVESATTCGKNLYFCRLVSIPSQGGGLGSTLGGVCVPCAWALCGDS